MRRLAEGDAFGAFASQARAEFRTIRLMKMTTLSSNCVHCSLERSALLCVSALLCCVVISPIAQAVNPVPNGGCADGNTAEGQNALFSRTTRTYNTAMGLDATQPPLPKNEKSVSPPRTACPQRCHEAEGVQRHLGRDKGEAPAQVIDCNPRCPRKQMLLIFEIDSPARGAL
jgi:hypothetical protein